MVIGGILAAGAWGLFHAGEDRTRAVITGVGSPLPSLSRDGATVGYLGREYRVRHAVIVIKGSGFQHGGGVVRGKNEATPVSRYALRFDAAPLPMSDLRVADRDGTRLSGTVRVPLELLEGAGLKRPHSFSVYDRIEGRFVETNPEHATTVRFTVAP